MKKITNFFKNEDIFQSSSTFALGAFLSVAIILTLLLSIRYYLYQDIIENEIAQKTLIAKNNFEVIDKQKTELIKREVSSKIRPVVTPVENEYIITDLQKSN